jgi:hypothetical protein
MEGRTIIAIQDLLEDEHVYKHLELINLNDEHAYMNLLDRFRDEPFAIVLYLTTFNKINKFFMRYYSDNVEYSANFYVDNAMVIRKMLIFTNAFGRWTSNGKEFKPHYSHLRAFGHTERFFKSATHYAQLAAKNIGIFLTLYKSEFDVNEKMKKDSN